MSITLKEQPQIRARLADRDNVVYQFMSMTAHNAAQLAFEYGTGTNGVSPGSVDILNNCVRLMVRRVHDEQLGDIIS